MGRLAAVLFVGRESVETRGAVAKTGVRVEATNDPVALERGAACKVGRTELPALGRSPVPGGAAGRAAVALSEAEVGRVASSECIPLGRARDAPRVAAMVRPAMLVLTPEVAGSGEARRGCVCDRPAPLVVLPPLKWFR